MALLKRKLYMKKRINIQYMVLAFVTIVAAVGISSLVFYNILKQDAHQRSDNR